jgi:hypothetical protein
MTGQTITLQKWPTFGLSLLFGSFYMAYTALGGTPSFRSRWRGSLSDLRG